MTAPVRHVALDTETTGFRDARVVEVAAVEFDPETGVVLRSFHQYVNPMQPVEPGAMRLHGLSNAFLCTQPAFAAVAPALRNFLQGSTGYAHNLSYDRRILDDEFDRLDLSPLGDLSTLLVCTLEMARRHLPHLANHKLDTLCHHYGIDASARQRHGALIDCELLVQVAKHLRREPPLAPRAPKIAAPQPPTRPGWCQGGPWHDDEKNALIQGYASNPDLQQLAAKHHRSALALAIQLDRMKILSDAEATRLGVKAYRKGG